MAIAGLAQGMERRAPAPTVIWAVVVTGGAVRLTGSGLGCPTWPGCTEDSYVPTAAMGVHGPAHPGPEDTSKVLGATRRDRRAR